MRRGLVFAVLTVPVAVWAGIVTWAQSKAIGWTPAAGELSLAIRAALASSNFVIRYLPFGALPAMLVWPLLVPCIASLTGARKAGTRRDIVNWWAVSAVAFAAMLLTGGVSYVRSPDANVPAALLAALAWTGMVAFLLSTAAAYSVQQERYRVHESGWSPRKLLAGLIVSMRT
jgi:hypothetical protein